MKSSLCSASASGPKRRSALTFFAVEDATRRQRILQGVGVLHVRRGGMKARTENACGFGGRGQTALPVDAALVLPGVAEHVEAGTRAMRAVSIRGIASMPPRSTMAIRRWRAPLRRHARRMNPNPCPRPFSPPKTSGASWYHVSPLEKSRCTGGGAHRCLTTQPPLKAD